MRSFRRFLRHDEGAITVEWVVLTAAVITLAASIGSYLDISVKDELKRMIDSTLSNGSSSRQ
ncbi:MAG: hypothetical protein PHX82_00885 [Paracoccaceae bacterium]|jgi:Flp pilus assembly pilin Flp|nr:hypothetical protein [Paracoccaceae bacterium]